MIGFYVVGFVIGYFVGVKLIDLSINYELARMHSDTLIKFFDPATGRKIDVSELGKVIERTYK